MPKIDLAAVAETNRTGYPSPHAEPMAGRWYRRLSPAAGLSDFGASDVRLEPGGISSQRHWHEGEDELVVMLEGEAVLVEDEGETVMRRGDVAAFPKGVRNGHHLVNRSDKPCTFVAVGKAVVIDCHYPDLDMRYDAGSDAYVHRDGSAY
jgi:uncharacterized cupin superfamily protein